MATRSESKVRVCDVIKGSFATKRVLQEYFYDMAKELVDVIYDELEAQNLDKEGPEIVKKGPGRPPKAA